MSDEMHNIDVIKNIKCAQYFCTVDTVCCLHTVYS